MGVTWKIAKNMPSTVLLPFLILSIRSGRQSDLTVYVYIVFVLLSMLKETKDMLFFFCFLPSKNFLHTAITNSQI